jgi:hypothetical protein
LKKQPEAKKQRKEKPSVRLALAFDSDGDVKPLRLHVAFADLDEDDLGL